MNNSFLFALRFNAEMGSSEKITESPSRIWIPSRYALKFNPVFLFPLNAFKRSSKHQSEVGKQHIV